MRFLVRVDAHPNFGIGHFMRCHAIAQHGRSHSHQFTFVSAYNTELTRSEIKDAEYDYIQLKQHAGSAQDAEQTFCLANEIKADFIILDGYHFDEKYKKTLTRRNSKLVTILDSDETKEQAAHIVLAPSLPQTDSVLNGNTGKIRILSGPKYALVSPKILAYRTTKTPYSSKNDLLVTLGGSDPAKLTLPIVTALKDKTLWSNIHVVVGSSAPQLEGIIQLVSGFKDSIILHIDCKDMGSVINQCGMAISAAGSTLSELATLGVPSIAITMIDNQIANTNTLEALGVIKSVNVINREIETPIGPTVALEAERLWNDRKLRLQMRKKALDIFDGRGIENFFQFLTSTIKA